MNASAPQAITPRLQSVMAAWKARSAQERWLLGSATAVLLLAVLWWAALGPALATWRNAAEQHRKLDAQLQTMRTLAAETVRLQALPRLAGSNSRTLLEASLTQALKDKAQLRLIGDRASVTLQGVPADTLVRWLAQVRQNAHLKPVEIHLNLNATRNAWDGSVVFLLAPP